MGNKNSTVQRASATLVASRAEMAASVQERSGEDRDSGFPVHDRTRPSFSTVAIEKEGGAGISGFTQASQGRTRMTRMSSRKAVEFVGHLWFSPRYFCCWVAYGESSLTERKESHGSQWSGKRKDASARE